MQIVFTLGVSGFVSKGSSRMKIVFTLWVSGFVSEGNGMQVVFTLEYPGSYPKVAACR